MRIIFLASLLATLSFAQTPRKITDDEVMRVHRSALLIDSHNDLTSFTVQGMDIGKDQPKRHTDLAKLKSGGVGAVFFAVYVSSTYVEGNRSAHRTLEMIDTVKHDIAAKYPGQFLMAYSAGDIERAKREGRNKISLFQAPALASMS